MLTDTSYLITNVGIMVVISAVFIILFYRQYTQLQNYHKKYIAHLEDSESKKSKEHTDGLESRVNAANKVNALLKGLASRIGAHRAYILELHNSANNFTGLPFAKFSMTYEHFNQGIKPIIHNYQNMTASTLAQVIYHLYEHKWISVNREDDILKEYQTLGWFMMNRGVNHIILVPLKDISGKIFGIIGFDFNENPGCRFEETEELFASDISMITGYLDFSR